MERRQTPANLGGTAPRVADHRKCSSNGWSRMDAPHPGEKRGGHNRQKATSDFSRHHQNPVGPKKGLNLFMTWITIWGSLMSGSQDGSWDPLTPRYYWSLRLWAGYPLILIINLTQTPNSVVIKFDACQSPRLWNSRKSKTTLICR